MLLLTIDLETGIKRAVPQSKINSSISQREYLITEGADEWTIIHSENTKKVLISAFYETGVLISADNYQIVDENTIKIKNLPSGSVGKVKLLF